MTKLTPPISTDKILLHACCAPCSSAIVECLLENGIQPTLFYYNPNIFPEEEYLKRKNEAIRHCQLLGLDFVDADYQHETWLKEICGLENEPERGARCLKCFEIRLLATAHYAAAHDFQVFATTLSTSRWKNLTQINAAGEKAMAANEGTIFWGANWRKGGLQNRRTELIAQYGFYNQTYCGCEFSMHHTTNKKA